VFGLAWSPLHNDEDPEPDLQTARKVGYNYGTVIPGGGLVGLTLGLEPGRGKPYSAVSLLVDRLSSAEIEAFLFRLGDRFGFVGLVERRPVSGFDLMLPNLERALEALTEFRSMHVGYKVRLVSNLDASELPDAEPVSIEQVVGQPDKSALVHRLINRPLRRVVGLGACVVMLVGGGTGWYGYQQNEEMRLREEAARQAYESDPNVQYERGIESRLSGAGQPGSALLDRWRAVVASLPLASGGWMLERVDCQAVACTATWQRYHGNFRDFDGQLPPGAASAPALKAVAGGTDGENLLGIRLRTEHPTGPPEGAPAGPVLQRAGLPLLREAGQFWGSVLQDRSLALAGDSQSVQLGAKLGVPVLFGPEHVNVDVAVLRQPVARVPWSLSDGLWSLKATQLPAYAIPEALTVDLSKDTITYLLTGSLYAKAKTY